MQVMHCALHLLLERPGQTRPSMWVGMLYSEKMSAEDQAVSSTGPYKRIEHGCSTLLTTGAFTAYSCTCSCQP